MTPAQQGLCIGVFGIAMLAYSIWEIERYGGDLALWNMPLRRLFWVHANAVSGLLFLHMGTALAAVVRP